MEVAEEEAEAEEVANMAAEMNEGTIETTSVADPIRKGEVDQPRAEAVAARWHRTIESVTRRPSVRSRAKTSNLTTRRIREEIRSAAASRMKRGIKKVVVGTASFRKITIIRRGPRIGSETIGCQTPMIQMMMTLIPRKIKQAKSTTRVSMTRRRNQ